MEACVVVLGDIGRSPRMQYHSLSLAKNGYNEVFEFKKNVIEENDEFDRNLMNFDQIIGNINSYYENTICNQILKKIYFESKHSNFTRNTNWFMKNLLVYKKSLAAFFKLQSITIDDEEF
ncbi:hypothetical protein RND71_043431 [Anisodus tanguticus]|uniref:Uncharacterized protein n=1 Tax=Anisodus tanguticus TaxID=243964 RepID=A0AAE1QR03_9SOLA|nr:hypothetical protein RND71_043431 [Anisodus tanguticus]